MPSIFECFVQVRSALDARGEDRMEFSMLKEYYSQVLFHSIRSRYRVVTVSVQYSIQVGYLLSSSFGELGLIQYYSQVILHSQEVYYATCNILKMGVQYSGTLLKDYLCSLQLITVLSGYMQVHSLSSRSIDVEVNTKCGQGILQSGSVVIQKELLFLFSGEVTRA